MPSLLLYSVVTPTLSLILIQYTSEDQERQISRELFLDAVYPMPTVKAELLIYFLGGNSSIEIPVHIPKKVV